MKQGQHCAKPRLQCSALVVEPASRGVADCKYLFAAAALRGDRIILMNDVIEFDFPSQWQSRGNENLAQEWLNPVTGTGTTGPGP